jgi:hypothetical protein
MILFGLLDVREIFVWWSVITVQLKDTKIKTDG